VVVGRLDLAHWHGKARRAVLRRLTLWADHVVANASAVREMLIAQEEIPADRITLIRNGIDLGRFDQQARKGLVAPVPDTGAGPVVIHVANMVHPVKRQEDLLIALSLTRHLFPSLQAFLVGDGPRRPMLERKAREYGLDGTVHFLGHRQDVPALYGRAHLGILCSSAEGLSNAVIEGMAAGLPMIVTRVGGNSELIADGDRGWVVDPMHPVDLYRAMVRALQDPDRGRTLGRAARAFVERELSIERLVLDHERLYRSLAAAHSVSAARKPEQVFPSGMRAG
jgi:L-malate glycosyltransferase